METVIDDPSTCQCGQGSGTVMPVATEVEGQFLNLNAPEQLSEFKELCKSVASLLHIEDQAAAAMLTESLSGRRDLVEGLDAEAIFDYLTQHGVLDVPTLQMLRSTSAVTQRNTVLLQHVEGEGHNAVALFINALRQSGQLHLASSLDYTPRIKPVSEGGYLEKQRHKGELTIIIKVQALLLVVPERDTEGDVIDASMLASPRKMSNHHPTRRLHQSYENMLRLDEDLSSLTRPVAEYHYITDDEEEEPKKKSFLCLCFSSRATRKKKAKEKKYTEQLEMKEKTGGVGKAMGTEDWQKERNGTRSSQDGSNSRLVDTGDVPFSGDARRNSSSIGKELSVHLVDHRFSASDKRVVNGSGRDKENMDPVIMEYNKEMELVILRSQKHRDKAANKSQSSAVVMCEKWKSAGQYFHKKLTALCEQFEYDLQTYVIKYIEQDRGTLVLSIWTDRRTMYVSNICMTKEQVRQLYADYTGGALREKLDALLRTNQCLQKLDIKDMDLKIFIDENQFQQALKELT